MASDKVFKEIVLILLKISKQVEIVSQNPVLEICESHQNHRFFAEVIAQIVNKGDIKNEIYAYTFIKDYYGYTEKPLFYTNDLMIMIDILLDQVVEIVSVKGVGLVVLEVLDVLVTSSEYQKCKYKAKEFSDLLKQFKSMGSLGCIRKDNYDLFKSIVEKVENK